MGKDVAFICGSDENGAAITMRAAKEGVTPQEIVDRYHVQFRSTFEQMGISFDIFHRTSSEVHHETAQDFFRKLNDQGEFIEKETEQYYDAEAEQFLADRYIKGECPKCGHKDAYGDQCENCGSTLSPTDLINPVSVNTGNVPVLKRTRHWYLPLDKYEGWLKEWVDKGTLEGDYHHDPKTWKNHVLGQCNSWIDGGLQPRSMTRDLTWGVDVPSELPGAEGKKLYVWLDAPIGYISATKQWAADHGKDWTDYWQSPDTELTHFIGKDNIVFHCIIFPAILKAHGDYILPHNVPANQFMNLEGDKISTSRNWAVWVHEYLEDFNGHQDELRYTMIKNMPEQRDSEFTWTGYQDAVNTDLVNNLANFVNRVMVLTKKYYAGVVPDFDEDQSIIDLADEYDVSFHDNEMLRLHDDLQEVCEYIRSFELRAAMKKIMEISSKGNQLLQANEPWKQQKEDPDAVKVVMNIGLQYVAALSCVIQPFLPFASEEMRKMLNLDSVEGKSELVDMLTTLAEGQDIIARGHHVSDPQHLFARVTDEQVQELVDKLKATPEAQSASTDLPAIKSEIAFDDFVKLDLRVGKIVEAEKVKKADKLLHCKVDIGHEVRSVVSGIAEHYTPEAVVGQEVVLVANLAPRKLRGIMSQGMILMVEDAGRLVFVQPKDAVAQGAVVS
jgi:methionyl-tRNA synthetase